MRETFYRFSLSCWCAGARSVGEFKAESDNYRQHYRRIHVVRFAAPLRRRGTTDAHYTGGYASIDHIGIIRMLS